MHCNREGRFLQFGSSQSLPKAEVWAHAERKRPHGGVTSDVETMRILVAKRISVWAANNRRDCFTLIELQPS